MVDLKLEIQALTVLEAQYKEAVKNDAPFYILLDIKSRIATIKDMLLNQLLQEAV